jgi:hypothetical protein
MNQKHIRQVAGILLIVGAILVNIPYSLLIMNFDYPDILRLPTGEILTRFAAGGAGLIWIWLAFAWVGVPILVGILLLPHALSSGDDSGRGRTAGKLARFFGATSLIAQMIGLLRWPFVVPVLARLYTAPQATEATREALAAVFQAVHQYGGVVLGEHIGQAFIVVWMVLLSVTLLQQGRTPRWLAWAGFGAAVVYALAQGELLATVMPGFPYWTEAGLVGSLLWLAWLVALGIILLRQARSMSYEHAGQNPRLGVGAVQ